FAEIGGARGVTFWVVLVNALVASILVARSEGRAWRSLAVALTLVLVVPTSWSLWRARTLELHAVATVAVVQPSIPQHLKLDGSAGLDSTLASLDRLLPGIEPGSAALTVLPEMTFPAHTPLEEGSPEARRVQAYAREVGGSILFGALGADEDGNGGVVFYNSAFLVEPQGLAAYRYDKRYLVPVAERSPLLPEVWLRKLPVHGGFGVGEGWPLAEVDGALYGVLVCYESAYPQGARSFRREGADVLVNITNAAWFGREPWWSRTAALWQHPSHLVMRAIENRVGVVRAANTGISLFVDPVGRVRAALPLFQPGILTDTVYTTGVVTFYTRHGD
ncbi:MAG TPA: apolipoprotein N-acyltransferase, partial [Longimicrobiales bacterium]|nr:apolipoprotein N-acyltransferase [Longimicrobiales bacterium]